MKKSKLQRQFHFLLFKFILLNTSGCDDLKVITNYEISELQYRIEISEFEIGDNIFFKKNIQKVCVISPMIPISDFYSGEIEEDYSEDYYRILKISNIDEAKIEIIHKDWMRIRGSRSFCISDGEKIKIFDVSNSGKLTLGIE